MTAYPSLRASRGSRQGCEMCFECRTGGQGLKTNWLESVQRTAAWFSGKPVSETVSVCRPLGAALCQPSPNILLFGAAHLSSRDMWYCTGSRCVGRGWILKHPLWSSTWGADVIWVPPLPRVAAAFCSWITKGRFPHLVSVCRWGWNAPFLQCKDQGRPVHERLPSENEATQHAGHLQLPFAPGSFCFFSLNKAYEELRQSCIQLARLELEFTQQANSAMMHWLRSFLPLLPSSSFIFSFLFILSLQECLPKCFLGGGGIQRSIIFVAWLKDFTIHPRSLCTCKIY